MTGLSRRGLLAGTALAGAGAFAVSPLTGRLAGRTGVASASTVSGVASVLPGDARYSTLSRGTNQRWQGEPERIHLVRDTEEVVAAVRAAVGQGKRIAVRSGGHCYEDFTTDSDVRVLIDMSAMSEVAFDKGRRAFSIGAGARLGDVYQKLYRGWGVYVPAGACPTVGAGGHIAGGGYGVWARRDGLSVDYLHAVEVVCVDSDGSVSAVIATADESDPHHDLWWAHTGGGGGNFGVVTRYWFRTPGASGGDPAKLLPAPPANVWISEVAWSWPELTEQGFGRLMRNHGAWHEENQDPGSRAASLFGQLKPFHRNSGVVMMTAAVDAGVNNAERVLENYTRAVGNGVGTDYQVTQKRLIPYLQATQWAGFTGQDPTVRFKGKSAYFRRRYTDSQIATMHEYLNRDDFTGGGGLLLISGYGGRVNEVAPAATAVPQRDSILKFQVVGVWNDASEEEGYLDWMRRFYRDLFADTGGVPVPNGTTDGCFVNYCDVDLNDDTWNTSGVPWHELYYKDNYARLQRAKRDYDPQDLFRHTQSVRP
ncbi:FAD-dependent oxidoreductase [Nocardiopsis sp. FIRDI 009]|uniref:FAD-dependent oxidoreductase n=1 Tax=Nocardiopsis sp. FIRDI 009 TaxID=714197 RepID=UPI000E277058|nr:FAD-binding protein [Nocardiopsis sp. FIRDI 009]